MLAFSVFFHLKNVCYLPGMKWYFCFHQRQLREEIRERKDKLESMLKPKMSRMRPESPSRPPIGPPRRRVSKSGATTPQTATTPSLVNAQGENKKTIIKPPPKPAFCSDKPLPITEAEENDRISAMEKRAVLMRSLGVVDAVYRLLNGTSGVEPTAAAPKKTRPETRHAVASTTVGAPTAPGRRLEAFLSQFNNASGNSKLTR